MNRAMAAGVLLGVLLVSTGPRGPSAQPAQEVESTDLYEICRFAGATRALAVRGDLAYVGVGGTLAIVDITNRTRPVARSEIALPNVAEAVAVDGRHAFVAAGASGLRIVDVADPARPAAVGVYDVRQVTGRLGAHYAKGKAEAVSVRARGRYVYLGFDDGEVHVVDVSSPASPAGVAVVRANDKINGMTLAGNLLFVAAWTDGLKVIDVSDPAAPAVRGSLVLPDLVQDVVVSGRHAYLANTGAGLAIVDVSEPSSLTLVGTFNPGKAISSGNRVRVFGATCYISNWYRGVYQVDVTDPSHPAELAYYPYKGRGFDLDGDSRFLYIGDYTFGLDIVDTARPESSRTLASVGTLSWGGSPVGSPSVVGNLVYMAFSRAGVSAYDLSTPDSPRLVGSLAVPYSAYDVRVVDQRAYIADFGTGLVIADVSNPAKMRIIGQYKATGAASTVTVSGGLVYLVVAPDKVSGPGVHVIDASDPSRPRLVSKMPVFGSAVRVRIEGGRAYISDAYQGVTTYDIGRIDHPVLLSTIATPPGADTLKTENPYAYGQAKAARGNVNGVDVRGDLVYAAAADYGVRVFDFADPAKPEEIGSWIGNDFTYMVTIRGRHAYVNQGHEGVFVLDVSTPAEPREVAHYDTPGNSWGIAFAGDTVVVSDGTGGVILYGRRPSKTRF